MKKLIRFAFIYVLPLFLLFGGNAALALDIDGDGVIDAPYRSVEKWLS